MNNNLIIIPTNPEEAQAGVLSALDTIFNPSNVQMQANRHAADQYLIAFQRAPVAWQLADKLLSYNANGIRTVNDLSSPIVTQVHFFAAQTLHVKCRSDILQLDPSLLPSLRDSLMAHLSNFIEAKVGSKKSNTVVITRLAMTLCSLAVQMQWTDIIGNLLSKVPMMNATTVGVGATVGASVGSSIGEEEGMIQVILEIAKILPEEAASERLLLRDESQRRRFREALVENSRALFQFLVYCITMHDTSSHTNTNQHQHQHHNMKEQVFRCLHSWVHYVHIHPMLLQESQLLNIAFAILQQYDTNNSNQSFDDEDVFELAVDVVVEVLRCYPSDRRENVGLVQKLIPLIMPLGAGAIGIAGEQQQQQKNGPFQVAIQEQDEDGMRAYCRIFTEMGESYMSLIMHHEDMNQKQLVDLVLACSAIPNDEIANITLNFWYRFITWMEDLEPYEYRQLQVDNFMPQLVRLVSTCTNLLRYPSDIDSLPDDRIDDIRRNRFAVCEALEDCCRLLGARDVINNIGALLQTEITRISALNTQEEQLQQWHYIESCFKALICTSRYTSPDENRILPSAMSLIPTLTTVSHLRTTANFTVGAFAMWLNAHPDHLTPILPFLAQGLSDPKCAPSAAVAIKQLCEFCSTQFSLGDSVLQLYDGIVSARQEQPDSSIIDLQTELEVLQGACKAISKQLEEAVKVNPSQGNDSISSYMSRIVEPIGNRLVQHASNHCAAGPKHVVAEIERLTAVIRFLNVPDEVQVSGPYGHAPGTARGKFIVDLMTKCWPLLDSISLHLKDFNSVEKLCRLHKYCLKICSAEAYKPLIENLRSHLVRNYKHSKQSPYLYAASNCVSVYGSDPSCAQLLTEMICELGQISFESLKSMEDLRNHPDVIEELFFLGDKMIQCCPQSFIPCPMFLPFLQCAAVGMKLDHRDANRGTLAFLDSVFSFGLTLHGNGNVNGNSGVSHNGCNQPLEHAVAQEGKHITNNIILALIGELPLYRIACDNGSIAGILFKLFNLCPGMLLEWVQEPLLKVPETEKSMLMNSLTQKNSRDIFFSTCERFVSVCSRRQKMGI